MRTYPSAAAANFNSTASQPPPSPPPKSSFRPSVAIVVGVAATLFSLTFLLLLYSNRCRRRRLLLLSPHSSYRPNYPSSPCRNSGLHRGVVSALPLFRFSSLHKRPSLDCAVCLSPFLPADLLRLLPRCRHAFHLDCVDTWLDSHSTCPLCRCRVHPDEVFLLSDDDPPPPITHNCGFLRPARVSGRHSSAGERSTSQPAPPAKRNSVDDGLLRAAPAPPRKDRLLPTSEAAETIASKRFEHCIVVSGGFGDVGRGGERWSDLQPSDLLFLRSEMLLPPRCESEITAVARRPHAEEERLALRRLLASAASRWLRAGADGRNSADSATGVTR